MAMKKGGKSMAMKKGEKSMASKKGGKSMAMKKGGTPISPMDMMKRAFQPMKSMKSMKGTKSPRTEGPNPLPPPRADGNLSGNKIIRPAGRYEELFMQPPIKTCCPKAAPKEPPQLKHGFLTGFFDELLSRCTEEQKTALLNMVCQWINSCIILI